MLPELVSSQPLAVSPKISSLLLPKAARVLISLLDPSSPSLYGLYLVHCASVWFLRLSFAFLALILPVMMASLFPAARLIRTSRALSRAALPLPALFNPPNCRIAPSPFPSFPSPHRGVSGQSKHKWHQGWPCSTLLLYLPSSSSPGHAALPEPERWQSPGFGHTLPSAANPPPAE